MPEFKIPEFKIPEFKTPELFTGDAYIPGMKTEIGYMYGGVDINVGAPSIRTMLGSEVSEPRIGKVFADEPVSWTATRPKGTQQAYEVSQRNDINWDMIRTTGDKRFIGNTNAEAANAGLAPQLNDGNFATLHHLGQDSRGGLVEASTRYHGVGKYGQDILHGQYGKNMPHPEFPIDRQKFGVDTREYWKWRVANR